MLLISGISALLPLLNHVDETIVGNAALCLSNCVSIPGVVQDLCGTDVLKTLLEKARDCQNQSAQQNCAILIAKLTQADERYGNSNGKAFCKIYPWINHSLDMVSYIDNPQFISLCTL